MKAVGAWIDDRRTRRVMAMLTGAGYRALFVGGCVRDAILGRPVSDIDISTDAVPEEVVRLAEAAGFRPVPTGIDHGTVTVVAGSLAHEVTTFRRDVETDGRRAVVAYSRDIRDDALRRDFTMNALYAEADGTVVDPLEQGLSDLAAGRVRFIEDAEDRIREDYLRILRFFRFHAWYGAPHAGPDPNALAAIAGNIAGLDGLSAERITHEILRLLSAPDPAPSVGTMAAAGVLSRVLPGADGTALGPLVHLETEAGLAPDPVRRLCALGAWDLSEARLRLPKRDEKRLLRLREALSDTDGAGALGYRLGLDEALDALVLRAALGGQPVPEGAFGAAAEGAAATFPVRAADLMPAYERRALGRRIAELERRWIASGFRLDRETLLKD